MIAWVFAVSTKAPIAKTARVIDRPVWRFRIRRSAAGISSSSPRNTAVSEYGDAKYCAIPPSATMSPTSTPTAARANMAPRISCTSQPMATPAMMQHSTASARRSSAPGRCRIGVSHEAIRISTNAEE